MNLHSALVLSREYRLKWPARSVLMFLTSISAIPGIFLLLGASPISIQGLAAPKLVGAAFLLASVLCVLYAIRARVLLDADSVSIAGLFTTRSLRFEDIKGRRTFRTRNGAYLVIVGKNPGDRTIRISNSFNLDDSWAEWYQALPDLDAADRQTILDAIAGSEELGATPELRLQKLQTAKTIAIVLSAATIVAALIPSTSFLFARKALSPNLLSTLDLLLILLPWVAFLLQFNAPLLYSLVKNKRDPRPTLIALLIIPATVLQLGPVTSMHFMQVTPLIAFGCLPGLILGIALWFACASTFRPPGTLVILLLLSCLYGIGVIRQIDTQLDSSLPVQHQTQILKKTYSTGKSTTYYFLLNPWEAAQSPEKVSVGYSLYRSKDEGDIVCVTTRSGALKLAWYTVQSCTDFR